MAATQDIPGLVAGLLDQHAASLQPGGHHGRIRRYLAGEHDLPIMPEDAQRRAVYESLALRSITNLLPRVSDTFVKLLTVDGIRTRTRVENEPVWSYWQANKLDARQTIVHRGAIEYGASYVLVLPGDRAPSITALDPLRSMAWYEDEDDDWPVYGLRHRGRVLTAIGQEVERWEFIDAQAVHTLLVPLDRSSLDRIKVESSMEHGLGVCPMVRFRDRLDGTPVGIIRPLITPQDRINDTVYALNMAMFFASFRQRHATGLEIPTDDRPTIVVDGEEVPNPSFGEPYAEFDAAIDRLWVTSSKDARFGEFNQTLVDGHLTAIHQAMTTVAVLGQLPAGMLKGDLVNVSADALSTLYDITNRQSKVYQLLFGEAWEQVFRLAAIAQGARVPDDAEMRWRDPEARSFAATVDALGKMVQMLNVPYEAAWEMIPGRTEGDFQRWRAMLGQQPAQDDDEMTILDEVLPTADRPQPVPGPDATPAS